MRVRYPTSGVEFTPGTKLMAFQENRDQKGYDAASGYNG